MARTLYEALLVILVASTLAASILVIHKTYTGFEYIARYQADNGGYVFLWHEKEYLGSLLHFYSPSYSSPYILHMNNPVLAVLPYLVMKAFSIDNFILLILIMQIISIIIAFISMYLLLRSIVNHASISMIGGLVYALSPLMLGLNFIPTVKYFYAIIPLALLYVLKLSSVQLSKGQRAFSARGLLKDSLVLLALLVILAWLMPGLYLLFLALTLYVSFLINLKNNNNINKIIIYIVLFIILIIPPVLIYSYGVVSVRELYEELYWERVSRTIYEYRQWSVSNFVFWLGFVDVDTYAIMKNYPVYYSRIYTVWVAAYSLLVWTPIVLSLVLAASNRPRRSGAYHVNYLSAMLIIAYLLAYLVNKYYGEIIQYISSISGLEVANIFRTPGRVLGLFLPLVLAVWGLSLNGVLASLRVRRPFYLLAKRAGHVLSFAFLLALVAVSVFAPPSMLSVYHNAPRSPLSMEWPYSTYKSVLDEMRRYYGEGFTVRVLDLSVFEPRYLYVGQKAFPFSYAWRVDLLYYIKSPYFRQLLASYGFDALIVSNYTGDWYFVRDPGLVSGLREDLYMVTEVDGLYLFSISTGRAELWVKVPEMLPGEVCLVEILESGGANAIPGGQAAPSAPASRGGGEESGLVVGVDGSLVGRVVESGRFTLNAWIRLSEPPYGREQLIVGTRNEPWGSGGFALFYSGEYVYFSFNGESFVRAWVRDWWRVHQVTVIFDGGLVELYIDGEIRARELFEGPLGAGLDSGGLLGGRISGEVLGISLYPGLAYPSKVVVGRVSDQTYYVRNGNDVVLRDYWVRISYPLASADDLSGFEPGTSLSLECGGRVIESPEIRVVASVEPLPPRLLEWAALRVPIVAYGGANALIALASLDTNAVFAPLFMGQAYIDARAYYGDILGRSPVLISDIVSPIDLWAYEARPGLEVIKLYRYFTAGENVILRAFGSHYWVKPFLGTINSDPLGSTALSEYQLVVPYGEERGRVIIAVDGSRLRDGERYRVLLGATIRNMEGRDSSIEIVAGLGGAVYSKTIEVAGSTPLYRSWIDLGELDAGRQGRGGAIEIRVLKPPGTIVFLDSLILVEEDSYGEILGSLPESVSGAPGFIAVRNVFPLHPGEYLAGAAATYNYSGGLQVFNTPYALLPSGGGLGLKVLVPQSARASLMLYLVEAWPGAVVDVRIGNYSSVLEISSALAGPRWVKAIEQDFGQGVHEIYIENIGEGRLVLGSIALVSTDTENLLERGLDVGYRVELYGREVSAYGETYRGEVSVINGSGSPVAPLVLFVKEPFRVSRATITWCGETVEASPMPAYGVMSAVNLSPFIEGGCSAGSKIVFRIDVGRGQPLLAGYTLLLASLGVPAAVLAIGMVERVLAGAWKNRQGVGRGAVADNA